MIIKTMIQGGFQVNNYLVICKKSKEAAIIDAGGNYQQIADIAKENDATIKYVLNTHGHMDHIAGDYDIQSKMGTKVLLHKKDMYLVKMLKEQLATYGLPDYEVPTINEFIADDDIIEVGELKFKVIHTPGHSPGSVCFLIGKTLFSGDTLFAQSVGRTDLPGGSYEQLGASIKEKLFTLDGDINVYPGHGGQTTIRSEKINNPFFGQSVYS